MSPSPRIGRTERALALERRRMFTRNPAGNPSSLEAARKALAEKRAQAKRRAQGPIEVNGDPIARSTTPASKPQIQVDPVAAPPAPIPAPIAAKVRKPVAAPGRELSWPEQRDRARQQIEERIVASIRQVHATLPTGRCVAECGTPEHVEYIAEHGCPVCHKPYRDPRTPGRGPSRAADAFDYGAEVRNPRWL